MRKDIESIRKKIPTRELLRRGFVGGVGWAFGATVGFAVVSTLLILILRSLGGLPFVGGMIASIVQATLDQLIQNSPLFSN